MDRNDPRYHSMENIEFVNGGSGIIVDPLKVPLTDKEIDKAFEERKMTKKEIIIDLNSEIPKEALKTIKENENKSINKLAEEAIHATGNSDAYSTGMCNGIEYMRACLTGDKPNFLNCPEKKDHINPDHYKSSTSLECIEAMELVFGTHAVIDFCMCNAWKYIWRWKHKNGVEDLNKAKWYIEKVTKLDPFGCDVILERMLDYINANNRPEQDGDKK